MTTRRTELVELTDRLIAEFDGLLPPGQVISAVVRAQRLVRHDLGGADRERAGEDIARRLLATRVRSGTQRRDALPVAALR